VDAHLLCGRERGEGNCGAVRHEREVLRGVSEQVAVASMRFRALVGCVCDLGNIESNRKEVFVLVRRGARNVCGDVAGYLLSVARR
jgi:hypothetical protein